MIISSEHQELLEEFKRANDVECEAIKAISSYTETTPVPDKVVAKLLFKKFEDALERKMALYDRLKHYDCTQPNE